MSDSTTKVVKTTRTPRKVTNTNGDPKTGKLPTKVARMDSKAEKIRALWMSGKWTRGQIVKAMGAGMSFQHVYNTTKRPTKGFNPDKFDGPKK